MASRFPTMTATVNADTVHRTVSVVVEHADAQSFSRAVEPRAKEEFRRWIREHVVFAHMAYVAASLAWHDVRDTSGRCLSVMTFTY